jgi:hypothetical protein
MTNALRIPNLVISQEGQLLNRGGGSSKEMAGLSSGRNMLFAAKLVMLITMAVFTTTEAPLASAQNFLKGVGYREQELQIAKGSKFQMEVPEGIPWATFAGGTHIFIEGSGLAEAPNANEILLESNEFA